VYFNIREDESVVQASFRGGKYNLLFFFLCSYCLNDNNARINTHKIKNVVI